MYYTRCDLFAKYKENDEISKRYFRKSNQWRKYSKEEREDFWLMYLKYDEIAFQYLRSASSCPIDGVVFVADEEFK